jgi:hypothetical protein
MGSGKSKPIPTTAACLPSSETMTPTGSRRDYHRHEDLDEANDSWMELVRAVSEAELGERAAEHDASMRGFLRLC